MGLPRLHPQRRQHEESTGSRVLRMRATLRHVEHSMFRLTARPLHRTTLLSCSSSRYADIHSCALAAASRSGFADGNLKQINATTQPSRGSIVFDFGGPGNINVDNFAGSNGQALLL